MKNEGNSALYSRAYRRKRKNNEKKKENLSKNMMEQTSESDKILQNTLKTSDPV